MRFLVLTSLTLIFHIAESQSIRDLDFLIGDWKLKELVHDQPGNSEPDYGERNCRYDLGNTYIRCESKVIAGDDEITFTFFFNYSETRKVFKRYGFFSHRSGIAEDVGFINGDSLHLISEPQGRRNFHRTTMLFADRDHIVWQGWTSDYRSGKEWKLAFTEEATRVK